VAVGPLQQFAKDYVLPQYIFRRYLVQSICTELIIYILWQYLVWCRIVIQSRVAKITAAFRFLVSAPTRVTRQLAGGVSSRSYSKPSPQSMSFLCVSYFRGAESRPPAGTTPVRLNQPPSRGQASLDEGAAGNDVMLLTG
jgi:hypothetical protein